MKIHLKLAVVAALCLPAFAQTTQVTTQTWVTIVPERTKQQAVNLTVSLPAGTTFRFVSPNGRATPAVTTPMALEVWDWDIGLDGRPLDPDPTTAKSMQVLQIPTAQSVLLIDSSVTPAKTTSVTVPALPPPTPPAPTTIWTGTASNTDLAGQVTLVAGAATQALTGTYATAPIVICTDTTAVAAVKCVASTTAITFTGTSTDVINYILIGPNGPRGIVHRRTAPKEEEHDRQ
jgi:hypothetical protein